MDGLLALVLGCLGCWVCAGLKPTKGSAGDQSFVGVEGAEFTGVGTGVAKGGSPDFESFDLIDDLEIKSWAEGGGLGSEFTGGFALVDVDEVHWFGLVWFGFLLLGCGLLVLWGLVWGWVLGDGVEEVWGKRNRAEQAVKLIRPCNVCDLRGST